MFVNINGTLGLIDNLLFYTYAVTNVIDNNAISIDRTSTSPLSVSDIQIHHRLYVFASRRDAMLCCLYLAPLYLWRKRATRYTWA